MITDEQLVKQLIDAVYESGYYGGTGEFASERRANARKRRKILRRQVLARLALVPDAELIDRASMDSLNIEDAVQLRTLAVRINEAQQ